MLKHIYPAAAMLLLLTLVTGVAYPLLVTGLALLVFPSQANGSLILSEGKVVGSSLIGQAFDSPQYFWSRPSATGPFPYNSGASSGSNLGPLNPALKDAVTARIAALRQADPELVESIPVDLVTSSGSGLDPDLSPAAATIQVRRVAKARGAKLDDIQSLVRAHTLGRQAGFLGEPRVNVLLLNRDLDRQYPNPVAH